VGTCLRTLDNFGREQEPSWKTLVFGIYQFHRANDKQQITQSAACELRFTHLSPPFPHCFVYDCKHVAYYFCDIDNYAICLPKQFHSLLGENYCCFRKREAKEGLNTTETPVKSKLKCRYTSLRYVLHIFETTLNNLAINPPIKSYQCLF